MANKSSWDGVPTRSRVTSNRRLYQLLAELNLVFAQRMAVEASALPTITALIPGRAVCEGAAGTTVGDDLGWGVLDPESGSGGPVLARFYSDTTKDRIPSTAIATALQAPYFED